ncbi:MAG: hypothetical protein AAFP84_09100 [Actinomycetota bacterium]
MIRKKPALGRLITEARDFRARSLERWQGLREPALAVQQQRSLGCASSLQPGRDALPDSLDDLQRVGDLADAAQSVSEAERDLGVKVHVAR